MHKYFCGDKHLNAIDDVFIILILLNANAKIVTEMKTFAFLQIASACLDFE